jgi:phosphatidylserine decarboxylase
MIINSNVGVLVKEGYGYIALSFIPLAFSTLLDLPTILTLIFLALFVFNIYFFRNPERQINNQGDESVLAPVDGKITAIERGEEYLVVTIENSFKEPHIVRSAIVGKMTSIDQKHGLFNSFSQLESSLNERVVLIQNHIGQSIKYELFYAHFPVRAIIYANENSNYNLGERLGFLSSGKINLHLPLNLDIQSNIGDSVLAGESLIGFVKDV